MKAFAIKPKALSTPFAETLSQDSGTAVMRFLEMDGNGNLLNQVFELIGKHGYELAEYEVALEQVPDAFTPRPSIPRG